ncbi:FecR domain-containing protein [Belliella sp. R4-6]|uniref:FecR domain-containing protein n=1 Tax=Belliella alkalica TaxID=1730871 RepID=A0ABS9VGM5_9BACT|nr:FecR family protein [Belliella alkalica]MCH7415592.1 FecR domain-containing protein [Belliella alkalica]
MYTKESFLMNPEFVKWVKSPNEELEIYWKNWLESNPEALPAFKEARELISGLKFEDKIPNEALKKDILTKILKETAIHDADLVEKKSIFRWFNLKQFSRVAAIFIFAVLISWSFYSWNYSLPEAKEILFIEKKAGVGEKLSFTLPDGTRVWLNTNSKLIFPEIFSDTTRVVELIGEGFFDVAKDEEKPFKVISKNSITTALGTSFNINTKEEGYVKISLLTGKVEVDDLKIEIEKMILYPSEEIIINWVDNIYEVKNFDSLAVLSWKEGRLIFYNNSLEEVKEKLEEWYGVNIKLINSTGVVWGFSGEYQNQSLEVVLKSMSYVEHFDFKIKDKQVEIKF